MSDGDTAAAASSMTSLIAIILLVVVCVGLGYLFFRPNAVSETKDIGVHVDMCPHQLRLKHQHRSRPRLAKFECWSINPKEPFLSQLA